MSERLKFETAIAGMRIPQDRRLGTPENARWFLRKGAVFNRRHPNILLAICHALRIAAQGCGAIGRRGRLKPR